MKGLSMRAYAAHRRRLGLPGGTHEAVRQALAEGRIAARPDGTIDAAQADRAWVANSRPVNGAGSAADTLARAQRDLARAKAELAQLRLAQERGELIQASEVRSSCFTSARTMRDRLGAVPARVGAAAAHLLAPGHAVAELERLMEAEIGGALDELATALEAVANRKRGAAP